MIEAGIKEAGLLPEQFWDLTLRELQLVLDSRYRQRMELWDIARTVGVWILSPHTKKRLKPKNLLTLPTDSAPKASTWEEFQKAIERSNGKSPASS